MSKLGQVTLIQSNLKSLPSPTMQCFQLPVSIINYLDKINPEFLLKTLSSSKRLPLVAWYKICKPQKYGGLGLMKAGVTNRPLNS